MNWSARLFFWAFATAVASVPGISIGRAATTAPEAAVQSNTDDARQALGDGIAALTQTLPDRDVARRAFERATHAAGDAAVVAEAHFRVGVLEEEDAAFARALAEYHACVDTAPASRWARNARSRILWIEQRSEGDLIPLAILQRMRRDSVLRRDPDAMNRLATEAESFPPGLVRSEARMMVAEAWRKLIARRDEAVSELRRVVSDPSSGPTDALFAERDLVEALLAEKKLDDAAFVVRSLPLDPKLEVEVERLLRRRRFRRIAVAELLLAFATLLGVVPARVLARRAAGPGPRPTKNMTARPHARLILGMTIALGGLSVLAAAYLLADALGSRQLQAFGF